MERDAVALDAADERLESKDGEIAALVEERRARDERIAALSTELADAAVAHKATLEKVARAEAEAERLNDLVRQEQAATAGVTKRNEQAARRATSACRASSRISRSTSTAGTTAGPRSMRSSLPAKTLCSSMEKTVKARDAVIAHHDEEKRQLAASIHDLERQCSELAGRRKEREEAYDELQKKLAAHFAQTEQLKTEHAAARRRRSKPRRRRWTAQRHIESLERGIKRRDESIEALHAEIAQEPRSASSPSAKATRNASTSSTRARRALAADERCDDNCA